MRMEAPSGSFFSSATKGIRTCPCRHTEEPFDKAYMRKLFNLGYGEVRHGYPWAKAPPWYTSLSSQVSDISES